MDNLLKLCLVSFVAVSLGITTCGSSDGNSAADNSSGNDSNDGSNDSGDDSDDGGTDVSTVTLSGQAVVRSSDVSALVRSEGLKTATTAFRPKFTTIGDTPMASADITLVKKLAGGTEENVSTTTTDAEGNYTLSAVPVCQAETGTSDDYYYEIRVTSGDVTAIAPACPSADVGDEVVNVSPESNIAAKIISDVVNVPGTDNNPVPKPAIFSEVRNLTESNVGDIEDSVTIPELSDAECFVEMANGVASAGGDAEKSYKQFQFGSEFILHTAAADPSVEEAASYLARVAKEGCQSSSAALPQAASEAMADAITSGTTFTPEEIILALNEVNDGPDVDATAKVTEYAEKLSAIEEAEAQNALVKKVELLGDETDLGVFFTKRELTSEDFSAATELQADQAVAFMETLANDSCNFGNVSVSQVVGALTGSDALREPAIDQAIIYNDSGFGCNGAGNGHFRTEINVYLPAGSPRTIKSVAISSTDTTSLGGDGTVTLVQNGPPTRYISPSTEDGNYCITIDEEVTYTITATMDDDSTVTKTLVRTHPQTMESQISLNSEPMTSDQTVYATSDKRPLISWTPPEQIMADYAVAPPEGGQVKYTYELSYHQISPDNALAGTPGCQMPVNSASLYSTSSVIPIADCDVETCATAAGTTPDNISCRINIQTYLFDPFDQQTSQAAGAFRRFCVDLNDDGSCG